MAEQLLTLFFDKVVKLAQLKARELCDRLDLNMFVGAVNAVVEHTVYEHTHVLYNRHLDQIILCAVYGVCKVNKVTMPFKTIMNQYKKFKEASVVETVVRTVVLEQTEDLQPLSHGDIIAFYNQTFMPLLKKGLVKLGTVHLHLERGANGGAPASPSRAGGQPAPSAAALTRSPGVAYSKFANVYTFSQKSRHELTPDRNRKTMVAYLHQETQMFQSPSKDLQKINRTLAVCGSAGAGVADTPPRMPPYASPLKTEEPFAKRMRH